MYDAACVPGLGLMGSRIALRLAERGHNIVAWNGTAPAKKSTVKSTVKSGAPQGTLSIFHGVEDRDVARTRSAPGNLDHCATVSGMVPGMVSGMVPVARAALAQPCASGLSI